MAWLALTLSLVFAALGALGVASPPRLLDLVRRFQSPAGLYVAAVIRLIFGAALFLAAPGSRAPATVQVLGVLVFLAGLVTPFFGVERFRRILAWWSARGAAFVRAWAVFALAFGLLLAYAVAP